MRIVAAEGFKLFHCILETVFKILHRDTPRPDLVLNRQVIKQHTAVLVLSQKVSLHSLRGAR